MTKSKDHLSRNTFESDGRRPSIVLRKGSFHEAVDRAEEVLLEHSIRLGIFQRAGEVVQIISLPEGRVDSGLNRPRSSVQLDGLSSIALTETFNRIAKWKRQGSGRIDCPAKIRNVVPLTQRVLVPSRT